MFYKDLLALPTIRLMAIDSEESKCLRQLRRSEHEPAVLLTRNPVPLQNEGIPLWAWLPTANEDGRNYRIGRGSPGRQDW